MPTSSLTLIRPSVMITALCVLVVPTAGLLSKPQPRSLPVATPHAENLGVFGSGYVDHPQGILRLRSTREGRVVEVLIQEQDLVEKGQLLFRMEDTLVQLEQRAAEKAGQSHVKWLSHQYFFKVGFVPSSGKSLVLDSDLCGGFIFQQA
jgi:multidrug efflux pump subunit AcrA (membrane-fusion protein)